MRKQFLEGCKSAKQACKQAPWASEVVKVEGGYMAFESYAAALSWRRQK